MTTPEHNPGFPAILIDCLVGNLPRLESIDVSAGRELHETDAACTAVVVAGRWRSISFGIKGGMRIEDEIAQQIHIQTFIKGFDESYIEDLGWKVARDLRVMLAADATLKRQLHDLTDSVCFGELEIEQRISKWTTQEQTPISDQIGGEFGHVINTTVEFRITT